MQQQLKLPRRITVNEMVDFVLQYRRGKVFEDWTAQELLITFRSAIIENCIGVDTQDNKIVGIGLGEPNHLYRIFHVSNILTISKGSVGRLSKLFQRLYPGWDIQGNRRNIGLVRYKNTTRLLTLLERV